MNWSVLLIVALLAYGLAAGQFPADVPHRPEAEYVVAAIVTAVAYMGSLLAHELAHSLVARRNGVQVEGITLWLLGGVSRLQGEVPSPGAEVRLAGVGPLTSLVLGGVFTLVAWLLHTSGVSGVVVAALAWLGAINLLLAVFNVIPAAPLDGGRLLQAVLWAITKDRLKAAMWAARSGQVFGWVLFVVGGYLGAGAARLQLVVVRHPRLVLDQRGHRGEPAGGGAIPAAHGGGAGDHDRRPGHRAGVGDGRPVPA